MIEKIEAIIKYLKEYRIYKNNPDKWREGHEDNLNLVSKMEKLNNTIVKTKTVLIFTGLIFYPVFLIVWYVFVNSAVGIFDKKLTPGGHLLVWRLALYTCIIPFLKNIYDALFLHKKQFYSLKEYLSEEKYSRDRAKAMFPVITNNYLYSEPYGIILGYTWEFFRKKYVCLNPKNEKEARHFFVNGGTGSGKTSGPIVTSLLSYYAQLTPETKLKNKISWVVIDSKPELAYMCTHGEPDVMILNPEDMDSSVGWDVFAAINKSSSDDDIITMISDIAEVLIPETSKENKFFSDSARTIMTGCMFYEIKVNKCDFNTAIHNLMQEDLDGYITRIKEDERTPERSIMMLSEFGKHKNDRGEYELDKSNAMQDIKVEVKQNLNVFLREDVKHFLDTRNNKVVCDATMVDKGKSIYLSIRRGRLNIYENLFVLIISQIIDVVNKREDSSSELPACVFVLDEFHNLGQEIPRISEYIGYIRSKRATILTVVQEYSKLKDVYGENNAETIQGESESLILSLKDQKLQEKISEAAGYFDETSVSYHRTGGVLPYPSGSENVSSVSKKVIRSKDFLSLIKRKEAIAVLEKQGYCRFNKLGYFDITWMREKVISNKKYNEKMKLIERFSGYKEFTEADLVMDDNETIYDLKENLEWARKYYSEWLKNYQHQTHALVTNTNEDRVYDAFTRYCGDGFHRDRLTGEISDYNKKFIDIMDEEFESSPFAELKENLVMYRVDSVEKFYKNTHIDKISVGQTITYPYFMSTSLLKDRICKKMPGCDLLIKIYVPKGANCLYTSFISHKGEFEMLFARGQKMQVIDICESEDPGKPTEISTELLV